MAKSQQSDLVVVYHRQPYEEVIVNKKAVLKENSSPNGIVPTLKGFLGNAEKGCWVAWKKASAAASKSGKLGFEREITIDDAYGNYTVVRMPLTAEQVKSFYHVTSKEALWPILHSFPWMFNYEAADWPMFREVNRLFAEAACEKVADDGLIWIHDYNLWLVPGYIRQMKPDAKIAFFHHTPFPSADIFNILPWREEIIDSLLQCDVVGFHIPRYSENFAGVARALRGVELGPHKAVKPPLVSSGMALSEPTVTPWLTHEGRRVIVNTQPIGTNPKIINELLSKFEAGERVAEIRREIGDTHLIMSVGRVDYVKGIREQLQAFERLLERRPEVRGNVKFLLVCAAAADGMAVYRNAQREIERLVGGINGKYGTLGWTPIMLTTRSIPFDELVCYFKAADTCWITPLRDGLNLVGKEYIAAQNGGPGILVLSEFAGAAVELPDAIHVNPYSAKRMDQGIDLALDMPAEERKRRMQALLKVVTTSDIENWASHVTGVFDELKGKAGKPEKGDKKTASAA